MLDIDEILYNIRQLSALDLYIQVKQLNSLARLAYEESLKSSRVHESHYYDLVEQIDDLILWMNSIFAFPPARSTAATMAMFGSLLEEFERIDRRLKTIDVVCDQPRTRKYKKQVKSSCWVDADGFRTRNPELAAVPSAVCPGAPIKSRMTYASPPLAPRYRLALSSETLRHSYETLPPSGSPGSRLPTDSHKFVLLAPKRLDFEDQDEAEEGEISEPFQPQAKEEKFLPDERFIAFRNFINNCLAEMAELARASMDQKEKFLLQCKKLQTLFSYVSLSSDYILGTPTTFKPGNPRGFIPTLIKKTVELASQLESRYIAIRSLGGRIDPLIRTEKCETIRVLNEVHKLFKNFA
jgi:hypothetical protein